mmetsp:Transcript_29465/g.62745  ORF Transcript_29465/g.62745 Transcript_29465/m.62745 type:complete len:372 (-) Transcript_29465:52-1167(-)
MPLAATALVGAVDVPKGDADTAAAMETTFSEELPTQPAEAHAAIEEALVDAATVVEGAQAGVVELGEAPSGSAEGSLDDLLLTKIQKARAAGAAPAAEGSCAATEELEAADHVQPEEAEGRQGSGRPSLKRKAFHLSESELDAAIAQAKAEVAEADVVLGAARAKESAAAEVVAEAQAVLDAASGEVRAALAEEEESVMTRARQRQMRRREAAEAKAARQVELDKAVLKTTLIEFEVQRLAKLQEEEAKKDAERAEKRRHIEELTEKVAAAEKARQEQERLEKAAKDALKAAQKECRGHRLGAFGRRQRASLALAAPAATDAPASAGKDSQGVEAATASQLVPIKREAQALTPFAPPRPAFLEVMLIDDSQ